IDVECECYGVRAGEPFISRLDDCVLAAVLRQQILEDDLRFLNSRGIELALDRKADLAILEAVQNVGFGNRLVSFVYDAPDSGTLGNKKDNDFLIRIVRTILNLEA